jgi:uncharacterized protein YjbI with pentapeptide repeats
MSTQSNLPRITIIGLLLVVLLALLIFAGYQLAWTGFGEQPSTVTTKRTEISDGAESVTVTTVEQTTPGKTLWDWLDLIIVSLVVGTGFFLLNRWQKERDRLRDLKRKEQEDARDEKLNHQAMLREYFDAMTGLILAGKFEEPDERTSMVAKARTLTVLRNLDLSGISAVLRFLKEAQLSEAVPLEGGDLRNVRWAKVDLAGANLSGANLSGADLREAKLEGTDLRGADLSNVDLNKADLSRADLRTSGTRITNLTGARLEFTQLALARYDRWTAWPTEFRESDLFEKSGALGPYSDLSFLIRLPAVDLSGVDLSTARLGEIELALGTRYDSKTRWPEEYPYRVSGAIGPRADLRKVDLIFEDLSRADLSEADLRGVFLSEVDLSEAVLRFADLRGAEMFMASLVSADLHGAKLVEASLRDADLREADLTGADLTGANLSGSDLRGAQYDIITRFDDDFDAEASGLVQRPLA